METTVLSDAIWASIAACSRCRADCPAMMQLHRLADLIAAEALADDHPIPATSGRSRADALAQMVLS